MSLGQRGLEVIVLIEEAEISLEEMVDLFREGDRGCHHCHGLMVWLETRGFGQW